MLKLFKWIYGLGYRKGYSDCQEERASQARFERAVKIMQNDQQFMEEIDEVMKPGPDEQV